MGLFRKDIFSSEEKREGLLTAYETELVKLKEDYFFALEFFEEYRNVQGFEEMKQELKTEYSTALDTLRKEVQDDIQSLRQRIDRINKNTRWMNSKQSADNMEGLNRIVGKLMAFINKIDTDKKAIYAENDSKEQVVEQPTGPQ